MTYSQKLKDPRWIDFRNGFIARSTSYDSEPQCKNCGIDTKPGTLRVHHRRYHRGREPWEYEDRDLILICDDCHKEIHALEESARDLIRQLEPHECLEMQSLINVLKESQSMGRAMVAAARAKNAVRNIIHQ